MQLITINRFDSPILRMYVYIWIYYIYDIYVMLYLFNFFILDFYFLFMCWFYLLIYLDETVYLEI